MSRGAGHEAKAAASDRRREECPAEDGRQDKSPWGRGERTPRTAGSRFVLVLRASASLHTNPCSPGQRGQDSTCRSRCGLLESGGGRGGAGQQAVPLQFFRQLFEALGKEQLAEHPDRDLLLLQAQRGSQSLRCSMKDRCGRARGPWTQRHLHPAAFPLSCAVCAAVQVRLAAWHVHTPRSSGGRCPQPLQAPM